MDGSQSHLQPQQLYSTSSAATLLGVTQGTLRSRKSRSRGALVKDIHWKNGLFWTPAGILAIAQRTSSPQAKELLAQPEKLWQSQVSPLTLVVDNTDTANNIEAVEVSPIDNLSADEEQAQDLDLAPSRSQSDAATLPLQRSDVRSRLIVAASVVTALILGGSSGWFLRASVTSVATLSNSGSHEVARQLDSVVAGRDRSINQSLTIAAQQQDAIDTVRRDYLLGQAELARKTTGTPVDQWLIDHLNTQTKALERSATHNSGSAQQIAIARSISGETRATLLALQSNQTPTRSYSSTAISLAQSLHQVTQSQPSKEANR